MSPCIEEPASELRFVVPVRTGPKGDLGRGMWSWMQTPGAGLEAESVLLCGNMHPQGLCVAPSPSLPRD